MTGQVVVRLLLSDGYLFGNPAHPSLVVFLLVLGYQIWLLRFAAWSLPFCIFGLELKPGAFLSWTFISKKLRSFSFLVPLPYGVVHFGEQYLSLGSWIAWLHLSCSLLNQS